MLSWPSGCGGLSAGAVLFFVLCSAIASHAFVIASSARLLSGSRNLCASERHFSAFARYQLVRSVTCLPHRAISQQALGHLRFVELWRDERHTPDDAAIPFNLIGQSEPRLRHRQNSRPAVGVRQFLRDLDAVRGV
jgi:hypothetical protein